jgi:hypothetical protein
MFRVSQSHAVTYRLAVNHLSRRLPAPLPIATPSGQVVTGWARSSSRPSAPAWWG